MKEGDKIIWDSGFGYEIGFYIGEDENQYYHDKCNMVTGVVTGVNSYPRNEVIPYDEETEAFFREKYDYSKSIGDF